MDAPVLPPSQEPIPAIVAIATDQPPAALSAPPEASLSLRVLDMSFLPAAVTTRSAPRLAPTARLSSSHRLRSFRFLQQAFWKNWAATANAEADIEVVPVMVTAQMAEAENKAWAAAIAAQCMPQASRELKAGPAYRISLRSQTIGYVADKARAYQLGQQLRQLVRQGTFNAESISPRPVAAAQPMYPDSSAAERASEMKVAADGHDLLSIDEAMAKEMGYSKEWAAAAWANNLRIALDAEPLSVGAIQSSLNNLENSRIDMQGTASWYGPYFHGRVTANGETYDQHRLTVAHKSLPFGTHLKVRNLLNDKTVVVRVNDRGPYVGARSLDLSHAAAKCLGSTEVGVIPYEAVILQPSTRQL